MKTNRAGLFLLVTSGIVGLALVHPLLLLFPVAAGVVLLFLGASDMPSDSPTRDPGR
jgi:hypothetical protein